MQDYRAIVDRIKGPLAPIFPAFSADEKLDLDATCGWVDWVVDQGMPMLWMTPGTSRYFSMSDQEIFDFTKAVGETVNGRCLLIAATNFHWPVHQVRQYIAHAADAGADIVKVTGNWFTGPSLDRSIEFHKAVAVDSPLPLFAYTLTIPGHTAGLTNELLEHILDMPQYVGMKNDSGDFYEHMAYLATIKKHGAAGDTE
jgi:dihydrodipicolinate synthase/N-acetylneuraminate lyase